MKKILEVLQCGDGELKFNTDLDVQKDPMAIMDLTVNAMFNMATRLWGGNEKTVIAVIRALFVADMAISVDRKIVLISIVDLVDALLLESVSFFVCFCLVPHSLDFCIRKS